MRKEHTFTDVTCCVVIHLISVVEWAFFDGERVSIVVLLNLLLLEVCIIHIYLFSTISLCLLHCSVPIQVLLCSMSSYCSYNLLLHMGAVLTGSTIETTIFLAVIQASLC